MQLFNMHDVFSSLFSGFVGYALLGFFAFVCGFCLGKFAGSYG